VAFELLKERHGGVLVLSTKGRLDNDNAAEFELAAQELINAGERHLVVDLSGLGYSSNAGLRVLGKIAKALRTPTTSLRLCGLSPTLQQVFDSAGITMVFDIRPDLAAALGDHPAARAAGELGREAARLLGLAPPSAAAEPSTDPIRTLAALAAELLANSGAAPRSSRAMADATQFTARVRPEDIARVKAQQAAEEKKPGFWQRLFGKGK
jgi:anti-sigma B factor antagonist